MFGSASNERRLPLALPVLHNGCDHMALHWQSQWHTTLQSSRDAVLACQLTNNLPADVGQPILPALELEGQRHVVDAHEI